jgi:hypothetical protein
MHTAPSLVPRPEVPGAPLDRPQLVETWVARISLEHADPPWREDLDRALDDPVGTTRHNDSGANVAARIVNDLRNRLAEVEWRGLPASGHGLLAATRAGPHRLEKYERAREPHVTSPSLLSPLLPSHPLLTMPTNGLLRQRH